MAKFNSSLLALLVALSGSSAFATGEAIINAAPNTANAAASTVAAQTVASAVAPTSSTVPTVLTDTAKKAGEEASKVTAASSRTAGQAFKDMFARGSEKLANVFDNVFVTAASQAPTTDAAKEAVKKSWLQGLSTNQKAALVAGGVVGVASIAAATVWYMTRPAVVAEEGDDIRS